MARAEMPAALVEGEEPWLANKGERGAETAAKTRPECDGAWRGAAATDNDSNSNSDSDSDSDSARANDTYSSPPRSVLRRVFFLRAATTLLSAHRCDPPPPPPPLLFCAASHSQPSRPPFTSGSRPKASTAHAHAHAQHSLCASL
ncbi:hypothetical protein P154DRAFT_572049 [Amniculicola lignicola CBS 123094]|uniref:Uncharacterized protein n=1 Tax=Amniculicola lignicola CBS 123094 TaxID=1392246 RepID=A0A6A5WR96_9PLEO|nr:hypothetical protein P154DRAFT_572049 [Amniculicola lignicola CBS 123094]